MAMLGQQLAQPESGWKRYSLKMGNQIKFPKNIHYTDNNNGNFKNELMILFKFIGSKIRVLAHSGSDRASDSRIVIDGISEFMPLMKSSGYINPRLIYEKILDHGEHTVEIYSGTNGGYSNLLLNAIDLEQDSRMLHPDEVVHLELIEVGKRLRCHYSSSRNVLGTFSGLGKETEAFLPVTSTEEPRGDFYFICVNKRPNGQCLFIADRNVQHTISYDNLIHFNGRVTLKNSLVDSCEMRLIDGGADTGDKENEWDQFVVSSSLNNHIVPGDNFVWNWKDIYSYTMTLSEPNKVVLRGKSKEGRLTQNFIAATKELGFRPVMETMDFKSLIYHKGEFKKYNNGWKSISTTLPSKDTFMNDGMSDLSVLERKEQNISLPMTSSPLGEGKLFKAKIDYKKYFDINRIDVK